MPESVLEDIPGLNYALHLFLASQMVEAEDYCKECDPNMYAVSRRHDFT